MREITVNYFLSDEEEERLKIITEKNREKGFEMTLDEIFQLIMFMGSKENIDEKFKWEEIRLGLREK